MYVNMHMYMISVEPVNLCPLAQHGYTSGTV